MSADVVERLLANLTMEYGETDRAMRDAATEISILRAALGLIATMPDEGNEWEGVDSFRLARDRARRAIGHDSR